eukprot:4188682-Pleurochrysis_carterae.AAC.2
MGLQMQTQRLAHSPPLSAGLRTSARRGLRPDLLHYTAPYVFSHPRLSRRDQRHEYAELGLRGRLPTRRAAKRRSGLLSRPTGVRHA